MVENSLVFVLPDGRSAAVDRRPARLICDRLWDLGITAGAATAAARLTDALRGHVPLRGDVTFSDREVAPVIEAAKSHPPTWASLAGPGTLSTITLDQRRELVATCLELIEDLSADHDHEKLRALIADLERLRDRLRAMTACEMLHDAAERVASGWCQGADARARDGHPVDVTTADATSWSLLGALQAAAFTGEVVQVEEIKIAVAAIARLIVDPSLAHWNDDDRRTQREVHELLARAEALTLHALDPAA